jgi:hypothetical protein
MATEMESLDPNFREFLQSLNSQKAKYLVLGGYAVNHYGYHRTTKDLDVWIEVSAENSKLVSGAMRSFGGFTAAEVAPSLFMQEGKVFAFGREPVRIDLLTRPSGILFEECYARKLDVVWDGVRIPLISLQDLRRNKLSSGRLKDLADLENLPTNWPPTRTKKTRGRKRQR